MSFFALLIDFVRRHTRQYFLAALMLAGVAALTVGIPKQVGYIVDELAAHRFSERELIMQLCILAVMGGAIYFLRVGWRFQLFSASYRLGWELRRRLYERISQQGLLFFQKQKTGDLMAMATNDADAIEMVAGEAALAGFDGSISLILIVGMMLVGVDWRLTLVALLPFPVMAFAFKKITSQVHHASTQALDEFSGLNRSVQQSLAGVRTVRSLGLEPLLQAEFAAAAQRAAQTSLQAQRWEAAYEPSVGGALTTSATICLGYGGFLAWQGEITVGELTAFTMYLGQLIWPMFASGWVLSLLERGKAAWKRIAPVLEHEYTVADEGTLETMNGANLRVKKLSLTYPEAQHPAINNLSFDLRDGQSLGITGPTGAGKTSVLRVLLRHLSWQQGDIEIAGHALQSYRLKCVQSQIAWVAQEPFLFSASIAENIALAKPDATREEIERVARLASVHDDILRFAAGYDTLVGERGVTLSGGQRQRIAIARALLQPAQILLLDDALSAVDVETETSILEHLRNERSAHGQSMIVISHRLSAIATCDHICVLKDGKLVAQGSHTDHLQQDAWYAVQWRYQQLEASLNAE